MVTHLEWFQLFIPTSNLFDEIYLGAIPEILVNIHANPNVQNINAQFIST